MIIQAWSIDGLIERRHYVEYAPSKGRSRMHDNCNIRPAAEAAIHSAYGVRVASNGINNKCIMRSDNALSAALVRSSVVHLLWFVPCEPYPLDIGVTLLLTEEQLQIHKIVSKSCKKVSITWDYIGNVTEDGSSEEGSLGGVEVAVVVVVLCVLCSGYVRCYDIPEERWRKDEEKPKAQVIM